MAENAPLLLRSVLISNFLSKFEIRKFLFKFSLHTVPPGAHLQQGEVAGDQRCLLRANGRLSRHDAAVGDNCCCAWRQAERVSAKGMTPTS